jgi:(1->4)-alpha-D-glucan 1-alpha-D-glucosylmutase
VAVRRFIEGALDTSRPNQFLADFHAFIGLLEGPAAIASLAQLVLKLTVPGVPDIYQGGELWDFSLVDPDNRRPVDWEFRRALLREVGTAGFIRFHGDIGDGRQKLFIMRRLLQLRRHHPQLFATGDYAPLDVTGAPNGDHLCAFARRHGEAVLIVAVPSLVYGLYRGGSTAEWGTAELILPDRQAWRDVLTGREWPECERLPVSELLADFPVSVLLGIAA